MKTIILLLLALLGCGSTLAGNRIPVGWRDSEITRTKALALLQTLNIALIENPSATVILQNWCTDHKMAREPHIRALRDHTIYKPADASIRKLLNVNADEPVGYRRVRLACGEHIFSEADNWYVKGRLTPEMNKELDSSDHPFGSVVKNLRFSRKTLSSTQLWSPLPSGWEMTMPVIPVSPSLAIPDQVLQNRALLSRADGTPFSMVVETYRRELFAFPLDATVATDHERDLS